MFLRNHDSLNDFAGDTLVFCFFDEKPKISIAGPVATFDGNVLKGSLEEIIEEREFKAEIGSTESQRLCKGCTVRTVAVVGLGSPEDFTPASALRVGAALASLARRHKSKLMGVVLPGNANNSALIKSGSDNARTRTRGIWAIIDAEAESTGGKEGAAQRQCLVESSTHSNYDVVRLRTMLDSLMVDLCSDNRFRGTSTDERGKCGGDGKDSTKSPPLKGLEIFFSSGSSDGTLSDEKALSVPSVGRCIANGVHFTRELVEAPANYCNTVSLANAAIQLAEEDGLKAKVLDLKEIEELKMGLYLAVGKGSLYPPRFIHLTYTPADGVVKKKVAFIGKGICFDSGGYNIKSAASQIELMKYDMSGAAAVLGSAKAIAQLKPPGVEVHFIVAAAENMVSRDAYRPGDVITASNGKTVEVGNTDAEGRLTLADALVYAERLKVDFIVDLATLTGACVVALGGKMCGLFSNNDSLSAKLQGCAELAGEHVWPLPIPPEYREALESKIADLNNVGGPKGGALIAAVFLQQFVESTPWAHLDIAGTAWNWKEKKATGFGVRTIVEFVNQTSHAAMGLL